VIVRELPDGTALVISQEGHADVAAQLAAHWGNDRFARLEPYLPVVFGTIYHDSGHREMEADLPIDTEKGLPYPFRGAPPGMRRRESDLENAQWIRARDPYARLVVTMHHAGLRKRRYDTVSAHRARSNGAPAAEEPKLGREDAFADLGGWAQEVMHELGLTEAGPRQQLWYDYQLLQVFDLLSLHFCCDGYQGDQLTEVMLKGVPVSAESEERVELRVSPVGPDAARLSPYPFATPKLELAVMARQMTPTVDAPASAGQEAYHRAPRRTLTWELTG
jgi:hypothetical protein